MKQTERKIQELTDVAELDQIAKKYANGGNLSVALKAWLRAEELGCTKYRKSITAQCFSPDLHGEERKKVLAMVKQWVKEGDKDALEAIELMKAVHGWKDPECDKE